MVTKGQLEKDVAGLVRIAYEHLPRAADLFFHEIRDGEEWLNSAVSRLPDLCREQARAMVAAGRHDLGLSDQEICKMALAAHREARCGVPVAPAPSAEELLADSYPTWDDFHAPGVYYQT